MSIENELWGAPHIHGELLKLGFAVAQSTVAKYMTKRPTLPLRAGAPSCACALASCRLSRLLAPEIAAVREGDATAHLALQHDQLMSERGILCFKPALRLEERGNHVQQEGYQRDHSRRRYMILLRNQNMILLRNQNG